MRKRKSKFPSVESWRPSALSAAASHPLHYATFLTGALALLFSGLWLWLAAWLMLDALALALVPRDRLVREQLQQRASSIARSRAAERLPADEQVKWLELDALVKRTHEVNARRVETDLLLSTYLNVALTLAQARACLGSTSASPPSPVRDDGIEELSALAAGWVERGEEAVSRLERQLATTACLIRGLCEREVAAHVEAAAGLWAAEVAESSRALRENELMLEA